MNQKGKIEGRNQRRQRIYGFAIAGAILAVAILLVVIGIDSLDSSKQEGGKDITNLTSCHVIN